MSDQEDLDAAALAAVQPFVLGAVSAASYRDMDTVALAWRNIRPHGPRAVLIALTALGDMAVLCVPPPAPDHAWMPVVRHHQTGEPLDPDDPENAPLTFAARFCTAAIMHDRDTQRALVEALLAPAAEAEPDPRADEGAADAWTLLTQLAAQGVARERVRRARTHQHPKAPHRPHPRDRRRR